jgi:hypothetical protein
MTTLAVVWLVVFDIVVLAVLASALPLEWQDVDPFDDPWTDSW